MKRIIALLAALLIASPALLPSIAIGAPISDAPAIPPSAPQKILNSIDVTKYGVSAAVADNATALQAAINAAISQGRPLYIPSAPKCYKYTAPLTINGNITIYGDYVGETSGGNLAVPAGNPPLTGSVLCPSSNGSDAVDITGQGLTVNLTNLGFIWQTPFTNTGHGIYYVPPNPDTWAALGLWGSVWNNVRFYGHDGNHYAVYLTDILTNTFYSLRSYGGGTLHLYGYQTTGNATFIDLYGMLIAAGSADGVNLTAAQPGGVNLLTFIRPQIFSITGFTASPPTSAQYTWNMDGNENHIRVVAPDMESNVGSPTLFSPSVVNEYDLTGALITAAPSGLTSSGPTIRSQLTGGGNANGGGVHIYPGNLSGSGTNGLVDIQPAGSAGNTYLYVDTNNATNGNEAAIAFGENGGNIKFKLGNYQAAANRFYILDNVANKSALTVNQSGTVDLAPAGQIARIGNFVSSGQTIFTATGTGACASQTTLTGGPQAGSLLCTGTAGASTITVTINGASGATAPNGWTCWASDQTSGVVWAQSGSSTTTATLSGAVATTSDKITFGCLGY